MTIGVTRIFVIVASMMAVTVPGAVLAQESTATPEAPDDEAPAIDLSVDDVVADLQSAWELISEGFVDGEFSGIDWKETGEEYTARVEAAEDALSAYELFAEMIGLLDNDHTFVIPPWLRPSEDDLNEQLLEYGGVGILLQLLESGEVMVLNVFRDTPAEAGRVLIGDIIVGVNDWRVEGENPVSLIAERVRGPMDTPVTLVLRDPEGSERSVEITRANIDLRPSVEGRLVDGTLGYLRIPVLSEDLVTHGTRALPQLLNTSGLILDLRSISYGSIEGVVQVAQWFIGAGHMGGYYTREGAYALPSRDDAIPAYHRPLVVLTNSRTYGVAEILAFLLTEYDRATVVGDQTAGGYEVSSRNELPSGGILWMSVALYISPSGEPVPLAGLEPDVEPEESDLATVRAGRDLYIEKAVEVLRNPKR